MNHGLLLSYCSGAGVWRTSFYLLSVWLRFIIAWSLWGTQCTRPRLKVWTMEMVAFPRDWWEEAEQSEMWHLCFTVPALDSLSSLWFPFYSPIFPMPHLPSSGLWRSVCVSMLSKLPFAPIVCGPYYPALVTGHRKLLKPQTPVYCPPVVVLRLKSLTKCEGQSGNGMNYIP